MAFSDVQAVQRVHALEYRKIPALQALNTPAGVKIAIQGKEFSQRAIGKPDFSKPILQAWLEMRFGISLYVLEMFICSLLRDACCSARRG